MLIEIIATEKSTISSRHGKSGRMSRPFKGFFFVIYAFPERCPRRYTQIRCVDWFIIAEWKVQLVGADSSVHAGRTFRIFGKGQKKNGTEISSRHSNMLSLRDLWFGGLGLAINILSLTGHVDLRIFYSVSSLRMVLFIAPSKPLRINPQGWYIYSCQ